MIQQDIKSQIQKALDSLGIQAEAITLEHPADLTHGDYSTNVALAYAKQAGKNPRALAEEVVAELIKNQLPEIEKIEIAGPGFINFYLSQKFFADSIKTISETKNWGSNTLLSGKKVMVEYTQPNPFKPFHIGHLMSNAIGESISRIVEFSGAKTIHANYQGDIGPHVAKAIWAILKKGKPDANLSVMDTANYIGQCYVEGSEAYENDPALKEEIDVINKKIYEKTDAQINDIYNFGRKVTLDAFEELYKTLGTKFDYYFFESEMAPIGMQIVKENTGKVFEESDGAIVFKAEKYNPKLHTRVFINSKGLPTYETKEIGLTMTKFEKENPDISITTTAIEQGEYMKVVQQAIALLHPAYEKRMKHITHGMMRFASGKMSSRKGNVITGESLVRDVKQVVEEKMGERDLSTDERALIASQVGVSALKYSILKQALGGDIIYDFEKSISFEGDSGPYIQYTAVRAHSLLEKAKAQNIAPSETLPADWKTTDLEKYLYRFPEVVERAYLELEPHHLATYMTELSSIFNSFYAGGKIVDEADVPTSAYKLALTQAFITTAKNGLYLLGIQVPERM
jgi:arginyl-tRNA synthetase